MKERDESRSSEVLNINTDKLSTGREVWYSIQMTVKHACAFEP